MARKTFEMMFQIGGKLASSFSSSFSGAKSGLTGLQNQARQTQRALDQLGNDFRRGKIDQAQYAEATDRLTKELNQLQNAQQRIHNSQASMQKFQNSLTNGLNTVKQVASMAALGTAAAATGTAFNSINKAMDFEAQLDSIQSVTGITEQQLKRVRDSALENGAATKYSALEAAQGFEELLKAGMSLDTALNGGLNSSLNLATAGELELAESATFIADALNGFKKDSMSAADAANILSGAANASSTDVREIGFGLSAVGPVADGLGTSFKEVNATLALFSNNSLKGSDAGTSLKTLMSNLVPKTKDATATFKKFGLINKKGKNILFDSNGELKDMAEVSGILQKSFKDLNAEQRQQVFYTMFGSDAIRAANILYKEGANGVKKMYDEMSKVSALDVAKDKMDNAKGSVEQLQGAFETMQIVGAEALNPIIKKAALSMADMLTENQAAVEKFGKSVAETADNILEPFTIKEPEKPDPKQFDSIYIYQEVLAQYEKDLAKFNKFENMDFGDKVVYGLDEVTAKTSTWLEGSGGESMNKIFTKLGEIAAKAWYTAFTNTVKTSMSEFGEGNVASGSALAIAAWAMGGGLLVKGATTVGKGVFNAGKSVVTNSKGGKIPPTAFPKGNVSTVGSGAATGSRVATKAAEKAAQTTGFLGKTTKYFGKVAPVFSKGAKILGKAAPVLAVAGSAVAIATSNDKPKTAVSEVSGLAAGLGGAKLGAAIGTVIAPGLGTAIGGALGGIVGYVGGKWLGNKAVDTARQTNNTAQPTTAAASTPSANNAQSSAILNQATAQLKTATTLAAHNFNSLATYAGQATVWLVGGFNGIKTATALSAHNLNSLATYSGQASGWLVGSFTGIKSNADLVNHNLSALATWTGQASGWMASLSNIPTASQKVQTALENLATRINNVSVPSSVGGGGGGKSKRVSYDG